MMEGTVYEIQKFALHDGPGIRTVIFLKGCPLTCRWCSNPESQSPFPQLLFYRQKCNLCMACLEVCEDGVFSVVDDQLEVDYSACTLCGKCIPECLPEALKIIGWKTDAGTLLREVVKDMAYFRKSGGGLTLSGGEPMMQFEFSMEILKLAKASDLHTCLETCGAAGEEKYEKILPYTDLFLFDYKHSDFHEHAAYTGGSLEKILGNLEFLYHKGADIILRCPIIPGITDHSRHFASITDLSRQYEIIMGVEIMPYHNWGSHKYEQLGMEPSRVTAGSADESLVESWITALRNMGCTKARRS